MTRVWALEATEQAVGRRVVEIAAGRAQEPVGRLLERLADPAPVAAGTRDMRGRLRAAACARPSRGAGRVR